jgi:hypothetical protein
MDKSRRTRKIIALSAGAAVSLSATAIVLVQDQGTSSERLKIIQSALSDGGSIGNQNPDTPGRVRGAARDR